jgi:hypothetical protein
MPIELWLFIATLMTGIALVLVVRRNQGIKREVRRALWPYAEAYMQLRDEVEGKDRD